MTSTPSDTTRTTIEAPLPDPASSDLPDSPMTTISEVIGPTEALQQESASRQATREVYKQRREVINRPRKGTRGRKENQSDRNTAQIQRRQEQSRFQPVEKQGNQFQSPKQRVLPQNAASFQPSSMQQKHQHQHLHLSTYPAPYVVTRPSHTQHTFNSDSPGPNPYQFTQQHLALPLRMPATPPVVYQGRSKSVQEDEYDRSRGAYFSNLPPKYGMELGQARTGVGEVGQNRITSMRADFDEVDPKDQMNAPSRKSDRKQDVVANGLSAQHTAEVQLEKGSEERASILDRLQQQEERIKVVEEGIGRLEIKLDRVLVLLQGTPGPAMISGETEGWWKEVQGKD